MVSLPSVDSVGIGTFSASVDCYFPLLRVSMYVCMIGTHSCQTDVLSMDCVEPCYSSWEW